MKNLLYMMIIIGVSGCTLAKVNVEVLSERTALENQVLGTYNSLDREMLLVASVRGVDSEGNIKPSHPKSREQQDAISAIQLIDFHSDDIPNFKKLHWVGENNTGMLEKFTMDKENIPKDLQEFAGRFSSAEFSSIIDQINSARMVIIQRVIDMNENLKDEDMPEVRKIFAKLNVDKALSGEKIQNENGEWIQKR
ncbi:MAG: DUF1318 domain-containing protein [Deltaproteobacteria bacterium]|nr:DUF1318 domain-containing protein [Deltaproteobacteria bacterium]